MFSDLFQHDCAEIYAQLCAYLIRQNPLCLYAVH